jgi:outer membrane protein assembly factor BamB
LPGGEVFAIVGSPTMPYLSLIRYAVLWLVALLPAAAAASGETPDALWAAAKAGDATEIERLLAAGVDPNARYEYDFNALLYAAIGGHADVVRVLLEHGADANAHDSLNHFTPLAMAATGGHCEVVRLLAARGADPDARDLYAGKTPLWFAASKGYRPCVEAMLGGDVEPATLDDALAIAERRGHSEVAELIRARRGTVERRVAWPQFRGPGASGVADGERPPVAWSGEQAAAAVLWKTPIPGLGHASPVLWGDRLFVVTAVPLEGDEPEPRFAPATESLREGAPLAWRVYCLDRRDGTVLWQRTAQEGVPEVGRHPVNSHASSTPATDGRRLVALLASRWLFAYDLAGELLWRRDLGVINAGPVYDAETHWGSASSPILHDGLVIVQVDRQGDSFLAAFDADDGEERWRVARNEPPSWGTPTVVETAAGPELVTNGIHRIQAYDPATGTALWHVTTNNSTITASTPVAGLGLVFVANGFRPLKPIYAIRTGGRGDLTPPADQLSSAHVAWSHKSGGPYYQTPLLYGEHLYVLTDMGVLTCYYAKTGELIYRVRVGKGSRFFASPVAADGHLYLTSEDGDVYVVRAGLEYEPVGVEELGERAYATPAIAGGMLYFRGRHHVIGIGPKPAAAAGPAAEGGDAG